MRPTRNQRNSGFSLIELIIVVVIIGIISAIAIPKMSRGARSAGANTLKMDLAVLRNSVELYATEHDGKFPTADVINQLTQYSDFPGTATSATKVVATGIVYGPYLKEIPSMPVGTKKGTQGVATSASTGVLPPQGAAADGWFWNIPDQLFMANLPDTDLDDDDIKYNTY